MTEAIRKVRLVAHGKRSLNADNAQCHMLMGIVIYSVKIKPKPEKLEMVNLPKMVGGDIPHAVVGEPVDNLHEMEVAMVLMGATALVAAMVAAQVVVPTLL